MRTGRFSRSAPVIATGARAAFKRTGVALTPGRRRREARLTDFHAEAAERYAALLGDMKGALMKAGQILSFVQVATLVPEQYQGIYAQALEALQADAPAMDAATVASVIEAELGAPPEAVFDRFSESPIAAASIGQVHAARVGDRELAVKVQYPGVADAVAADLENTGLLAALMRGGARLLPGFSTNVDFDVVVEEIAEHVSEELDYEQEARNQAEFHELFRGHPFIRVPEVVPELSSARVLTQEMVDGRRFQAACESPAELRDRWGEVIVRFVGHTVWTRGLFNADPHPGNYLFHEDGSVTFLDFGCVKRFSLDEVTSMRTAHLAVMRGDAEGLVASWREQGFFPDGVEVDPQRVYEWYLPQYEVLLGPQPFTYTKEMAAAAVERMYDPFGEWKDVVRAFRMPKHTVFLNRITVGLNSVLGLLEVTGPWRAINDEFHHDTEPATELGALEAEWVRAHPAAWQ